MGGRAHFPGPPTSPGVSVVPPPPFGSSPPINGTLFAFSFSPSTPGPHLPAFSFSPPLGPSWLLSPLAAGPGASSRLFQVPSPVSVPLGASRASPNPTHALGPDPSDRPLVGPLVVPSSRRAPVPSPPTPVFLGAVPPVRPPPAGSPQPFLARPRASPPPSGGDGGVPIASLPSPARRRPFRAPSGPRLVAPRRGLASPLKTPPLRPPAHSSPSGPPRLVFPSCSPRLVPLKKFPRALVRVRQVALQPLPSCPASASSTIGGPPCQGAANRSLALRSPPRGAPLFCVFPPLRGGGESLPQKAPSCPVALSRLVWTRYRIFGNR